MMGDHGVLARDADLAATRPAEFAHHSQAGDVRSDLVRFFGPRHLAFLRFYERTLQVPSKRRLLVRSWSWPAFFLGFAWFFYRKMYVAGAAWFFVPVILSVLGGRGTIALWALMAMQAKSLYLSTALKRIGRADELGLSGAERAAYLQRAGGISIAGGFLAGTLLLMLIGLATIGQLRLHHRI